MDEYKRCIDHLAGLVKETIQLEVGRKVAEHQERIKKLSAIDQLAEDYTDHTIHYHEYMIEFWQKARRDVWELFKINIKTLRDNG